MDVSLIHLRLNFADGSKGCLALSRGLAEGGAVRSGTVDSARADTTKGRTRNNFIKIQEIWLAETLYC